MAYSLDELTRAYTDLHVGLTPNAATQQNLKILAGLTASGQVSNARALSTLVNGADDSTTLAIVSYQFFTGKSPTAAGLTYLVNSPVNTADLNDGYYAQFNLENRYINFAANLGVNGQGALAFAAKYGAMDFADYVASIYETIIGSKYALAAGVDVPAAVAYLIGTRDAVLATITSAGMIGPNSTAEQVDIALKAAMAGLVMAASITSDIGLYAAAANNMMVAIATHTAVYNTNITVTYAPDYASAAHGTGQAIDRSVQIPEPTPVVTPPSSSPFSMTAGRDHLTGGAGDDIFTADDSDNATIDWGDTLNGGRGHDTLNILSRFRAYQLNGAKLTLNSIETVNLDLLADAFNSRIDIDSWTGVQTVNATVAGGTSGIVEFDMAVSTDLNVTMSNFGSATMIVAGGHDVTLNLRGLTDGTAYASSPISGALTLNVDHVESAAGSGWFDFQAGGNFSVTQTASNAVGTTTYMKGLFLGGGLQTTSVVVRNARETVADGTHAGVSYHPTVPSVRIQDVNTGTATRGVIATVDIDGYRQVKIQDSGLTTLKLAHGRDNVEILNAGAVGGATTLDLTLNGVTDGVLSDQGVYTTFNVTMGAERSTLDNINASALTALNLGGASHLTLTSAAGLTALQTVTVTGSVGLTADLSNTLATSVSTAGTTGANAVTLNGATAFTGGAAADTVAFTSTPTAAVTLGGGNDVLDLTSVIATSNVTLDGGAGAADVLRVTDVNASYYGALATNFERLELVLTTSNPSINVSAMGGAFHHLTLTSANAASSPFLLNLGAIDTLVLNGPGHNFLLYFGTTTLNLELTDGSGAGVTFADSFDIPGMETVNLTVTDSQATPTGAFYDSLNWRGSGIKTFIIDGNAGFDLTTNRTTVTTVDASGITLGGFKWTAGVLNDAVTVKGSATGTNTLDFTSTTKGVTYTGGAGADIITVGLGANTIDVGIDNSVDQVVVTRNTNLTDFTTIINLAAGDQVRVPTTGSALPDPPLIGVSTATPSTLIAEINSHTRASDGSTGAMFFIHVDSDTYIYVDRNFGWQYEAGTDAVIKLTGVTLTSANYDGATGWITI